MIYSERSVGQKHYNNGFPSSPKLKDAAHAVIDLKKTIRNICIHESNEHEKIEKLRLELKEKYKELRKMQKSSKEMRKVHLYDLVIKLAKQWSIKEYKAVLMIKEAEESHVMHKKYKRMLKPLQPGAINNVYVPQPVSNWKVSDSNKTNTKCQIELTNQQDIFDILLRQNYQNLQKSKASLFMSGQIHELIKRDKENKIVERLLKGIEIDMIQQSKENGTDTMLLVRPLNEKGEQTKDFIWEYGLKEFKQSLSKTREVTACGPSGLHMSH